MAELPAFAAWRHVEAWDGFEVLFPHSDADGYRFDGYTTAVEGGDAWAVSYSLTVDAGWATRSARIVSRTASGERETTLGGDGGGAWRVDGAPAPELDGCLDVDLEASAFTNAFPVHRLRLVVGERADAPAVYVRAVDLSVERLEQTYERLEDDGERARYDYAGPRFDYHDELVYDRLGFVLTYPGLAVRIA